MPYIGEGTYGCVFKPHLKCAHATSKTKDDVGKVFSSKSAFQEELDILEKIKKLDPDNEFTLPIFFTCPINHKHRKSDKVEKCRLIHSDDTETNMQIIMKNGGKSLGPFVSKGISHPMFFKFFTLFTPLIKGAVTMESTPSQFIHQDIKPENILYRNNKLFLIDFGIFTTFTDFADSPSQHNMMSADYPFFPADYKLIVTMNKNVTLKSAVSEVLGNISIPLRINNEYFTIETIFKHFHPDLYQQLGSMYATLQKQKSSKMKKKDIVQHFTNKINIYQLGLVMAMLYFAANLHNYSSRRLSAKSQKVQHIKNIIAQCIHPNAYLRATLQDILTQL
jgi:serine/threonine protein kinase